MVNYLESSEDYLEAILMLKERLGQVHSIDIVYKKGYTKASISIAMKKLREKGYIEMDDSGCITLTAAGLKIARRTYSRHKLLTEFLISFGIDPATAESDACKIEHDISDETFEKIKHYVKSQRN